MWQLQNGPRVNMRGPYGNSGGHFLSGPVYVCGAEPGDLLQVSLSVLLLVSLTTDVMHSSRLWNQSYLESNVHALSLAQPFQYQHPCQDVLVIARIPSKSAYARTQALVCNSIWSSGIAGCQQETTCMLISHECSIHSKNSHDC